ncbi:MAG: TonB-dependent receptor [Lewinellaceae bacterium]|nr:TonB-dependent receptor [Lewinellaceae bacterium]
MGNVKASYTVVPNLVASISLAQERANFDFGEYYSKQSKWRGIGRNGLGIQSANFFVSNLLETTAEYTLKFQESSNLKFLGGYSWQQFEYNGIRAEAGNIISNEFTNANLGTFLDFSRGLGSVSSYKGRNRLIAFFGRASLNINDTYFASVGLRREGSSRFGPDNRWGVFPFASAGANLEKLLNLNNVEQLKLRLGYGVTGNQPNQNSLYREVYSHGALFYYNGNYVPELRPDPERKPGFEMGTKRRIQRRPRLRAVQLQTDRFARLLQPSDERPDHCAGSTRAAELCTADV